MTPRLVQIVGGFAALIALASACDPPPRAVSTSAGVQENQARLVGVSLDRFEADRLSTRTHLEQADVDRETGVVLGREAIVEVRAKDDPPKVQTTITAPTSRSRLRERKFTLEGGVRIVDAAGRTLTTERLDYDANADHLQSAGEVHVAGENFDLYGRRLKGQPRLGQLQLEGPVRAEVRQQ